MISAFWGASLIHYKAPSQPCTGVDPLIRSPHPGPQHLEGPEKHTLLSSFYLSLRFRSLYRRCELHGTGLTGPLNAGTT